LISYVKFLFPRNKVQIIITTHSPFIASDLPKQNLICLVKNKNTGACEVIDKKTQKETFGSNIHELFADSFFIEGALIGDFAMKEINDIIGKLQNPAPLNDIEDVRSKIRIIGEPIIKTKLSEMLAEKIGDNAEKARLRSQQEYIINRLKELK